MSEALSLAGLPAEVVSALPVTYSRNKFARCQAIAAKPPLADFVARTWPGVPPLAWAGFMSNGSGNEDTAVSASPAPFHEIGYFGTTAGPSSVEECPNRDTSKENDWFHFYNNAKVRELLGRDACMAPGCWKESNGGFADQCAVGLVSMLAKYNTIHNSMPVGVRPESPSNIWGLALTFAGWSAGIGGTLGHLRPFYDRLAAYPEDQRWDAWGRLLAQDLLSGATPIGAKKSHRNPAYTRTRTQQKIAAATQGYEDTEVDHIITMAAFGHAPTGMSLSAQTINAARTTRALLPWLLGGAAAYGLYDIIFK